MRTRNRTLTTTAPSGEFRRVDLANPTDPNFPYVLTTGPQTDWTRTETMTDEMSYMRKYGSVDHTINEVRYFPVDLSYDYWYLDVPTPDPIFGHPRPRYRISWKGAGMWRYYLGNYPGNSWGQPTVAVPSTFDWSSLSYHAVKNMRPALNKSGLLILNFISELAEFCRRKATKAKQRNEIAERQAKQQAKYSDKSRERHEANKARTRLKGRDFSSTLRGALQIASKLNLFWQFAVIPTISDVREVLDRINNLEKRLQELIKEQKKIQTRHYTCPIPDRITLPTDVVRFTYAYTADHPGYTLREETRWEQYPQYHATMRFNYDASALQGIIGTIRAHLSAFGADRLLSSVWEAIPFSFVVDWFINVGEMLASLEDHLNDPIPLTILDFTHSVKWSHKTRIIHSEGQLGSSHVKISGILLMERCVTRYIRRAEAPSLWASLSTRLPGINQVGLAASLFGSKGPRVKPL